LAPLALVLAAAAVLAYRTALGLATDAYDRSLLDPALAMAQALKVTPSGVALDMSKEALEALRVDTSDRLYFSVSQHGQAIVGPDTLPPPPAQPAVGTPVFYDTDYHGEPVRVAAIAVDSPAGPVVVQAAETLVKRNRLVQHVLAAYGVLGTVIIAVALAAVWIGVARGLAPLKELRGELATRSHRDLRPVAEQQAPEEVRPLVRELNELLHRLAVSMELQQQFVADAAHQLRTPLAALQAQVEAARGEPLSPALARTVEQLHAATRRAAHLSRQLLTLAAVDPSAERPYSPQRADLGELLQRDVSDWLARADTRRIDLGFEFAAAPVQGEPELIVEAASNLLDNALTYTPQGGVVTLRTGRRDGVCYLEVEDDGPGIPEAERAHVFERFHRVKGTPGQGAGLGLAIVREIAHRHGASVALGVGAGGRGARVSLSFPAV
ncbi:MAG TPA: sensor histidine kinase N-terminal domain-containing protein, partial [Burkholderiales bacterium]|nr:sensor histidine kinase N-terminal domain-containing protein [Burkholderiales bacterium]